MIRHTVTFRLKHPRGSAEERSFLSAAAELVKIRGVEKFESRPPHSPTPVHVLTVSGAAGAKANFYQSCSFTIPTIKVRVADASHVNPGTLFPDR